MANGRPVYRDVADLVALGIDYSSSPARPDLHEEVGLRAGRGRRARTDREAARTDRRLAERLVDAFEAPGWWAGVGHIERYNPALQEPRRRLEAGELGTVYQIVTRGRARSRAGSPTSAS